MENIIVALACLGIVVAVPFLLYNLTIIFFDQSTNKKSGASKHLKNRVTFNDVVLPHTNQPADKEIRCASCKSTHLYYSRRGWSVRPTVLFPIYSFVCVLVAMIVKQLVTGSNFSNEIINWNYFGGIFNVWLCFACGFIGSQKLLTTCLSCGKTSTPR